MGRHRLIALAVSGALGAGLAIGIAACGEDRGDLTIEGGTTGTSTSGMTGTTSTGETTSTTTTTP